VILSCVTLLAGVVAFHSIVMVLIALAKRSSPKSWGAAFRVRWAEPRFRVLTTLAVLPLMLTFIAGLIFRLRPDTNMVIGIFSLMPLLFLELAGGEGDGRLYRLGRAIVVGITLGALALSPAIAIAKIWYGGDINYTEPRKELARKATEIWHETIASPLQYVAGSQRYENAIAFYSADRPHGFTHQDAARAPWVTPEDLDRAGLLVVCAEKDKGCLTSSANITSPRVRRIELTLAHSFWGYTMRPSSFIITVVSPRR
jgi:hypothetical protein